MGGQRETLIPSRLKHVPLTFHKANNIKLKLIAACNASIYDNMIDYL